jgi:hypothetical protein
VECSLLLEILLKNSPYNYQAQMLLAKVYVELGALKPAIKHHNKLGVKQIQTDSLSWMMMSDILRLGGFAEGVELCNSIVSFHSNHKRDVAEWVQNALACQNLVQAREIWEFDQKRMVRSHQLAVARAELFNLVMLEEGTSPEDLKKSLEKILFMDGRPRSPALRNAAGLDQCCSTQESFDGLFWNYDFEVMNHWQPLRETDDTTRTEEDKRKARVKAVAGPAAHGLCAGFSSFAAAAVGSRSPSLLPCSPFANGASALLPTTSFEWMKVHASVPRFFLWSMQGRLDNSKEHFEKIHQALHALRLTPLSYSPCVDVAEDKESRTGRIQKLVEEHSKVLGMGAAFWVVVVEACAGLLACLAAVEAEKKNGKSAVSAVPWSEAADRFELVTMLLPLAMQSVVTSKLLPKCAEGNCQQPEAKTPEGTTSMDVSPLFLTQLSSVVLHQLQWTVKVFAIVSSTCLPQVKRKGGSKGGKKKQAEATTPVSTDPVDVTRAGFVSGHDMLLKCVNELRNHTKSSHEDASSSESSNVRLPHDADVFVKNSAVMSSDRLAAEIRDSHRMSLDRLQDALKKQVAELQCLRV